MRKILNRLRPALGLVVFCLAPAVYADIPTVAMQLTGVGNGSVMGGVYVSPYDATINGTPTKVICDDFAAHTGFNQTWSAYAIGFDDLAANLGTVRWGSQGIGVYQQAAWLSLQLFANPASPQQGQLSFAIWGLFDSNNLNSLDSTNRTAAEALIKLAREQSFAAGQFSNFVVYTPTTGLGVSPQEFLAVRAPEPPFLAVLFVNAFALFGVVIFFRRRMVGSNPQ